MLLRDTNQRRFFEAVLKRKNLPWLFEVSSEVRSYIDFEIIAGRWSRFIQEYEALPTEIREFAAMLCGSKWFFNFKDKMRFGYTNKDVAYILKTIFGYVEEGFFTKRITVKYIQKLYEGLKYVFYDNDDVYVKQDRDF